MIFRAGAVRTFARAAVLIAATGLAPFAAAESPVGPVITIQATAPISQDAAVAFNPLHEEFLVVWWNEVDSNSSDVWACRIGVDGTVNGPFVVATAPGEKYFTPAVAYNSARDEYFIVYVYEYAAGDTDIRGRSVSWNGGTIGSELLVVTENDRQEGPSIAYNPVHDEYVVAYTNYWASALIDVAAQRVGGDLTLLSWANVATGPGTRANPVVAFDPVTDQVLIAYDYGTPLPQIATLVYGKVAASSLAGVSTAPEIVICGLNPAGGPAVASGGDGYLATWYQPYTPRARRLAPDGTPQGASTGFEIADGSGGLVIIPERWIGVAYAEPLGYVVVWHEHDSTPSQTAHVRGRLVRPFSDEVIGGQLTIADDITDQEFPRIACAPWGTCLVAYLDTDDIYAKMLRFNIFAAGFERGDTSEWSASNP